MMEDLNSKKMENEQTTSGSCGSQAQRGSGCCSSQSASQADRQFDRSNATRSQSTGSCTDKSGTCSSSSANANTGTSAKTGTNASTRENSDSKFSPYTSNSWSESWDESFAYDDGVFPEYHQMSLSVSRFTNGEQTDIRIHRETGKSTEVYVSQGSEAWDLGSNELHLLPKALRKEVEWLLNPSETSEKSHWWSSLLSFGQHRNQRDLLRDQQSETLRDKSHDSRHDQLRETLHSGSSEKSGMCGGKSSCDK